MTQYNTTLKGWSAAIIGIAIVAVALYQFKSRFRPVEDSERAAIQVWLVAAYQGHGAGDLMRRLRDHQPLPTFDPSVAPRPFNVELSSLSAHGTRNVAVVKAHISVDAAAPPDGRSVRYFNLDRSPGGDWIVMSDSDSFTYLRMLLL